MEFWIVSAIAVLASALVSFLVVQAMRRRGSPSPADTAASHLSVEIARFQERERNLNQELSRLSDAVGTMTAQLSALQADHAGTRERLAAAEERAGNFQSALAAEKDSSMARITRAEGYISERENRIKTLQDVLDDMRTRLTDRESELAAAGERETALRRAVAERDEQLKGLQGSLKTEFENIASNVLTNATEQLTKRSQESLSTVLDPLKERINEFKEKVDASHKEDVRDRSVLAEQIRQLGGKSQNLGDQAESLAKALKGDSGLRGNWGEVRLERILELSGLERGREYVVQGGDLNIKSEEGRSQRPDVVILLPENRHLIIDSKISLISYLDYDKSEDDKTRAVAVKELLGSCRNHIDDLASKSYPYGDGINSHDLVLMFMPIEPAVAVALKHDDTLIEYAWNKKIVIVSPGSLFLAMRTVSSIWRYERQNQNAKRIADQAGRLYDKLVGFVDDLNEVSQKLHAAAGAHYDAVKKLSFGRGNVLGNAKKLKELGVASKKTLPMIIVDGQKHAFDDDEDEFDIDPTEPARLPAPGA